MLHGAAAGAVPAPVRQALQDRLAPVCSLQAPPAFPMALPSAAPERQLKHRRSIDVQVYARGNGLWEVDARLTDIKTSDQPMADGVRRAGEPIHEMLLRLVVDAELNIVEAGSQTLSMPYPGHCDGHGDPYAALTGLSLRRGFRLKVLERLRGVAGCTHLTELSLVLPTAVIQALAGEVIDTSEGHAGEPPFQIDRCQALRADGEVVRQHYPRWWRPVPTDNSR